MTIVLSTPPYQQFYDSDGNPLAGGKIYTYLAGTLTPRATYTDQGGGTQMSNPIILDSAGRTEFWLDNSAAYDFVINDSLDNPIRTVENVSPFNSSSGLANLGNIAALTIVGNNTGATTTPLALTVSQVQTMLGISGSQNLIINGNMDISQRGTMFVSPSNNDFTLDRFAWVFTGAGVVTISQDSSSVPDGSQYSLKVAVTTADSSLAASDNYAIVYRVEGKDATPLKLGKSTAATATLSFWVRSSITGTYYVSFKNPTFDRSYPASYTISSIDTWEYKTITLVMDTTGTWQNSINTIGVSLHFALGTGSTFEGTANTWNAGNFNAASGSANAMSSTSNIFQISQIKFEIGAAATTFIQSPIEDEIIKCRRYYEKSFSLGTQPAQAAGTTGAHAVLLPTGASGTFGATIPMIPKRSAPSITTYNPVSSNADWRDTTNNADRTATVGVIGESSFIVSGASGAAGSTNRIHWAASSELL